MNATSRYIELFPYVKFMWHKKAFKTSRKHLELSTAADLRKLESMVAVLGACRDAARVFEMDGHVTMWYWYTLKLLESKLSVDEASSSETLHARDLRRLVLHNLRERFKSAMTDANHPAMAAAMLNPHLASRLADAPLNLSPATGSQVPQLRKCNKKKINRALFRSWRTSSRGLRRNKLTTTTTTQRAPSAAPTRRSGFAAPGRAPQMSAVLSKHMHDVLAAALVQFCAFVVAVRSPTR